MKKTMNSGLSKFFIFATGAAIGSVVTWKIVKTKYEQIANEEIESVREYYAQKDKEKLTDEAYGEDEEEPDADFDAKKEKKKAEMKEYRKIISGAGYSDDVKEDDETMVDDKPFVISPEDAEDSDYDIEHLDYYEGDDVLADSFGDVITNIDGTVGADFASHFGEYEADTVFVQNDAHRLVYEICRDFGNYSEV